MSGNFHSRKQGGIRQRSLALLLCLCALLSAPVLAAEGPVGVVYPDIREPFRGVFISIAKGVSDELGREAAQLPLEESAGVPEIQSWIASNHLGSVIALGSRGPLLSEELDGSPVPVVVGAVHMSPELQDRRYYGISLSPDPSLLLERLRTMAPGVKRVTVVYHRDRDRWMIDQAKRPAARFGLELNAVAVDRLQEAAGVYRDILAAQASDEALWLLQDSAVLDEQAVLPMILKEAWNRKLIVFSSNPSHVRRGVLFALYPDNYRMGRSLGALARTAQSAGQNGHGMDLLHDLSMALNVRTAEHIGLKVPKELLRDVDLVFPLK